MCPPLYTWSDTANATEGTPAPQVDVVRSFAQHDVVPAEDELPADFPAPVADGRKWTRVIGVTKVIRGPSWNGSKGNWVVAFLLAAAAHTLQCPSPPQQPGPSDPGAELDPITECVDSGVINA